MGKTASIILLAVTITLAACAPASPTATPPSQTVLPTPTEEASPTPIPPSPTATYTPSPSPTPTHTPTPAPPTPTPLPRISASCYPDASAPLEDLVILRGPEHLFDPSCQVSGGVGQITASWDIDRNGIAESTQIDPTPTSLAPGEYRPLVTFSDEAGQTLQVELPRIVKVGEPRYPDWRHGVHLDYDGGHLLWAPSIEPILRDVDTMSHMGIHAVRIDFAWNEFEPDMKGRYENFERMDQMIHYIRAQGIGILGIISWTPRWASSSSSEFWRYKPTDVTDYGDYVQYLVSHYELEVDAWEIWHEPNCNAYLEGTSATDYAEILRQGYLAVKYSDPDDVVVLAGLANDASEGHPELVFVEPGTFLRSAYGAGVRDYFDVLGRNPYAHPVWEGLPFLLGQLDDLRSMMISNGDSDTQIWITENGWSAYGHVSFDEITVTEEMQAQWLIDSYTAMSGLDYVGPIFWYNFRDKNMGDPFEDNLGLVRRDRSIKPVGVALRNFIAPH